MSPSPPPSCTAFSAGVRIMAGPLMDVALAVQAAQAAGASHILIFDDRDGRPVELDLRGSPEELRARLESRTIPAAVPAGRGRPKLGVTAREVTLLPSHWEWLAAQPGGASAALRRLVDEARRAGPDRIREASETAYRVMSALAGNAPQFEEATRAFFAKDYERFTALSQAWPRDVADYVGGLVRRIVELQAEAR